MWRWAIRIVAAFLVLVAVLAGIVHLVLRSEWLEDLILARVSERTGLEITTESLDVGWGGGTRLQDAVVRMPVSDEVILTADRIELTHEIIPLLILGRPVNVRSVEVSQPRVYLRRYEDGRWNVEDAWTRLRARLESRRRRGKSPSLPQVAVRDALIQVEEPNGAVQTLGPLEFEAHPQGQLVWAFDLQWPRVAEVEGRLLEGRDWAHGAGFAVKGIEPLIRSVLGQEVSPVRAKGRWRGRIQQDSVQGMLSLEHFVVGQVSLQGNVAVEVGTGRVILNPRGLVVREPNVVSEPVRLTGGTIRVTGEQVSVWQLDAVTSELSGHVNGGWDLVARTGEFSGSWAAALDEKSAEYYGDCKVSVEAPKSGRTEVRARVTATAKTSFGTGNIAAVVEGAGADWRRSQWRLSFPALVWTREDRQVDMAGAAAVISLEWPVLRLTALDLPHAQRTSGAAEYRVDTRLWSTHVEVRDFDLKALGREDLDISLTAQGDERQAFISELRVAEGGKTVTARGRLSFHERGLQDVHLVADWPAGSARPGPPQEPRPVGHWHLEANITGRVQPLMVQAAGAVTGQNIAMGKQMVSRVDIPIQADVDAERVKVATQPFSLLAGRWEFTGQHNLSSGRTQLTVVADNLSLEAAAGMAGLPLTSQGQVHAQIQLAIPDFDVHRAVAIGSWSAEDVNIPPLRAEAARGKLRISGGVVRFDDILLEQEQGEAQASMEFRLDRPQVLAVELKTNDWPLRFEDQPLALLVNAQAKLRLNVVTRSAGGEAQVAGRILLEDQDFGRIHFMTVIVEQTVSIRELVLETLGGSVQGRARIPLNRWQNSEAQLKWQGIEPKRLGPWISRFEQFEGMVSGSLTLEQVPGEAHPLEPMRLALDADVADGGFGPAQIDSCHIIGYAGSDRLLIDEARFRVLDGQCEARARVTRHAGERFVLISADFNDLDLSQLVHAMDPNAGVYVGRLAGDASILSSSGQVSLGGKANVRLTESDLAGNSIVQALHSTLNLQFGKQQPTGTGEITVQFEGSSLVIPSVVYFNRGVEIRGAGRIRDVILGSESPIEGYAVASTRVLKGIELPGVDSLDRLLATFQTGAASVKIGGTLDEVKVEVVPLPLVLGSFRRLLWAQLRD